MTPATPQPSTSNDRVSKKSSQFVPRPTTTSESFLSEFWSHVIRHAEQHDSDFKDCHIPLARIKKLIKTDPDVKMIANEATVLLEKACEANSFNRRTVHTSDIAVAISKSDMFDFLIDIVPALQHPLEDAQVTKNQTSSTSNSIKPPRKRQLSHSGDPNKNSQVRKKKSMKLNPNLLPEEVAVPIPDSEQLASAVACSAHDRFGINQNIGSFRETWEMALPITEDRPTPSIFGQIEKEGEGEEKEGVEEEEDTKPLIENLKERDSAIPIIENGVDRINRSWERAIPIDDLGIGTSSRTNQNERRWNLAIPIQEEREDLNNINDHKIEPIEQETNWELAIPIIDQDNNLNNRSNWELAVPIIDRQNSIDPNLTDLILKSEDLSDDDNGDDQQEHQNHHLVGISIKQEP